MRQEFTCKRAGRLDVVMSDALNVPRAQVEKLIKTVGVEVNGMRINKCSYGLIGEEMIAYLSPVMEPMSVTYPITMDVPILYEDAHLLVVNKPPFLTVHGAPSVKEATLVDWLKHKGIRLSTLSGEERHGIVHRIDKETSGALVIAKTNTAHVHLSEQLERKSMGRYYLALIDMPLKESTVVNLPIARHPQQRTKMSVVKEGRMAQSAFCKKALSKDGKKELIVAKLFTGRTHQIRVHLHALSRHILGDGLYGFKSQNATIPRVMLHAYELYLVHPHTQEPLRICAPLWDDFTAYLSHHFEKELVNEIAQTLSFQHCFDTVDEWVRKEFRHP